MTRKAATGAALTRRCAHPLPRSFCVQVYKDLGWWADALLPVLDHFVAAAAGQPADKVRASARV